MSWKAFSWLVGILGVLAGLGFLLFHDVVASVMADARTERLTGHGVDIFLLDPYPTLGEPIELEISARGGSRAGIVGITVTSQGGGEILATRGGQGARWGSTIRSGRSRGHEDARLAVPLPQSVSAGDIVELQIAVRYVCAMRSGSGRFSNQTYNDTVHLPVRIHSSGSRALAWALLLVRSLLLFGVWCFGCHRAVRWVRLHDKPVQQSAQSRADGEQIGVALLMVLVAIAFLGYWLFARPIAPLLGGGGYVTWTLAVFWTVFPLAVTWKLTRGMVPLEGYLIRQMTTQSSATYRVAEEEIRGAVSLDDVAESLESQEFTLRRKKAQLLAQRVDQSSSTLKPGKRVEQVVVTFHEQPATLDQLDVQATGLSWIIYLAHDLTKTFGPVRVIRGEEIVDVDGQTPPDQILLEYSKKLMAKINSFADVLKPLFEKKGPRTW